MNKNFCKDLYDDILKTYQAPSKYKLKTNEDGYSTSAIIEYIPSGINNFIESVLAFSDVCSYIDFQLKNPVFKISIKLSTKETGEDYLFIKVYPNIKTACIDISEESYYLRYGNYSNELLIYSENSIFSSIKITELCKFYNKRDYLEKTFDLRLPKSVNKLPLNQSYAACCALKYVNDEQTELLFSSQFDFSRKYNIDKRKQKSIGIDYLYTLMSKRFSDVNMLDIIADYIYFSLQLNKKIDAFAGKKKIIKLHDELAEKIMLKANRSSKTQIRETPLKYLKMPKEFVRLKTQEALIAEGKRNHNCVGGYWKRVLEGKSLIYSADIQNEHLTIEIRFCKTRSKTKKYNFYINQCYKAYNRPCSPSVLEYVKECLESNSENAIKEFNAKQISL